MLGSRACREDRSAGSTSASLSSAIPSCSSWTSPRRGSTRAPAARRGLSLAHGGEHVRLFWHEVKTEQKLYWRSRELAFFTFALPIVIFFLLGSVYGHDTIDGAKGSHYLLAGMLGYGVTATA